MQDAVSITTPLNDEILEKLRAGNHVVINGIIYSARDAAHKRLVQSIHKGEQLPIDLTGQIIYYVGPTPSKPNSVIGAAGPTTSYRMDPYAPLLIEHGLKGMIGKGARGNGAACLSVVISIEDVTPDLIGWNVPDALPRIPQRRPVFLS